jgi:DNA-directed RNA polymerase sigma subunit (sigma70/sigma32)
VYVIDVRRQIDRLVSMFEADEGRAPTLSEIARALKITRNKIVSLLRADLSRALSFDMPTGHEEGNDIPRIEMHPNVGPSPEEETNRLERESWVRSLVARLPFRDRAVITGRFWKDKTLQDIATGDMGKKMSRERVRQIEVGALDRLRKMVEKDG